MSKCSMSCNNLRNFMSALRWLKTQKKVIRETITIRQDEKGRRIIEWEEVEYNFRPAGRLD